MAKKTYDLTIVTPSFNQAEFIGETFESILSQDTKKFRLQYIIVDGLSTDGTDKVVKRYLPKFKQRGIECTYLSEKDHGQSDAINKGWRLAKGSIVTYLNSDDYYQPRNLHRVVKFFQTHPEVEWAYGGWRVVNREGKLFHNFQHTDFHPFAFRSYASNIGQPACFYKKSLLDRVGQVDPSLHLAMDYDLWLRFLKQSQPAIMSFPIANLRYYGGAKSAKFMTKHNWQAYQLALRHAQFHPLVISYATLRFLLGWLAIKAKRNISQTVEQKKSKAS